MRIRNILKELEAQTQTVPISQTLLIKASTHGNQVQTIKTKEWQR